MKAMNVEQGFWRKRVEAIDSVEEDHEIRARRRRKLLIIAVPRRLDRAGRLFPDVGRRKGRTARAGSAAR